MEITLEAIDAVRERTGVGYKEAKEALEKNGGNVVEAIISLEEQSGKKTDDLMDKIKAAVKEGNVNKIRVKRGDEVLLTVPVNAGIGVGLLGLVAAPWWGILAAAAAAYGFNCRFEIVKADGSVSNIIPSEKSFEETVDESEKQE